MALLGKAKDSTILFEANSLEDMVSSSKDREKAIKEFGD